MARARCQGDDRQTQTHQAPGCRLGDEDDGEPVARPDLGGRVVGVYGRKIDRVFAGVHFLPVGYGAPEETECLARRKNYSVNVIEHELDVQSLLVEIFVRKPVRASAIQHVGGNQALCGSWLVEKNRREQDLISRGHVMFSRVEVPGHQQRRLAARWHQCQTPECDEKSSQRS
jgi:hypothetical protein